MEIESERLKEIKPLMGWPANDMGSMERMNRISANETCHWQFAEGGLAEQLEDQIDSFGLKTGNSEKRESLPVGCFGPLAVIGLAYTAITVIIAYTHGGEPRKKSLDDEKAEEERNRYCTKDGKRTIW